MARVFIRQQFSENEYVTSRIFRGGQEIRSEILPKIRIAVAEILGS
jgi:Uma2 family endonuclease